MSEPAAPHDESSFARHSMIAGASPWDGPARAYCIISIIMIVRASLQLSPARATARFARRLADHVRFPAKPCGLRRTGQPRCAAVA